jgi:hypothetical protein
VISHNKARFLFFDRPGRREAATVHRGRSGQRHIFPEFLQVRGQHHRIEWLGYDAGVLPG